MQANGRLAVTGSRRSQRFKTSPQRYSIQSFGTPDGMYNEVPVPYTLTANAIVDPDEMSRLSNRVRKAVARDNTEGSTASAVSSVSTSFSEIERAMKKDEPKKRSASEEVHGSQKKQRMGSLPSAVGGIDEPIYGSEFIVGVNSFRTKELVKCSDMLHNATDLAIGAQQGKGMTSEVHESITTTLADVANRYTMVSRYLLNVPNKELFNSPTVWALSFVPITRRQKFTD